MPTRRNYRRKSKKQNYSKVPKTMSTPLPNKFRFNMRYCDNIRLDASATNIGYQTYELNNLFDPDYTNGGTNHQPLGYDQISPMYNRYIVTGAKITATIVSHSVTGTANSVCGITLHDGAAFWPGITNPTTIIENGRTVYKLTSTANSRPTILTKKVSMKKEFAVNDLMDNIQSYGGLTSAGPENGLYCTIWQGSVEPLVENPDDVELFVQIDFVGYFTEPQLLAAS